MGMPDEGGITDVVLIADPRVTAVPVRDNGEQLVDVRERGLRVSSLRADDAGLFAQAIYGARPAHEPAG